MSESTSVSILIPIYNYNIYQLVKTLSDQATSLNLSFEILCYDDASTNTELKNTNKTVSNLPGVTYHELTENIGRSRIRNKLAQKARYNFLLFIDCDSTIISHDYLENYIRHALSNNVIIGGTVYNQSFSPEYSLRLKYGKNREQKDASFRNKSPYLHINLNNLFIQKEIYLRNQLDEKIFTYGHEDTKFGFLLKEKKELILHIDNPIEHCGLESNLVFISKTEEGIKNFYRITFEGYGRETKLYKIYSLIKKLKMQRLFTLFYSYMKVRIEKNLRSSNPSLLYFDLFKLKKLFEQETSRN